MKKPDTNVISIAHFGLIGFIMTYSRAYFNNKIMQTIPIIPLVIRTLRFAFLGLNGINLLHRKLPFSIPNAYPYAT